MRVGDPAEGHYLTLQLCHSHSEPGLMADDLRPADHMDGARVGFVIEEFNIGDGLRHLEGILLLFTLRFVLRQLKQHQ